MGLANTSSLGGFIGHFCASERVWIVTDARIIWDDNSDGVSSRGGILVRKPL